MAPTAVIAQASRRQLVLAAISTLGLSACTTAPRKSSNYPESVSSILITPDATKIVFIGRYRTYIFDAPEQLIATFHSPIYPKVRAHLSFVKDGADITGTVDLELVGELTDEDIGAATQLGYRSDAAGTYLLRVRIDGHCYAATDVTGVETTAQKLNRTYDIRVEDRTAAPAYVDGPSPLKKTKDGLLFLGALPLILLFLLLGGGVPVHPMTR